MPEDIGEVCTLGVQGEGRMVTLPALTEARPVKTAGSEVPGLPAWLSEES